GYGLWLDNTTADTGPDRVSMRRIRTANGVNGWYYGSHCYLIQAHDCYTSCTTGNCVYLPSTALVAGENLAFYGHTFDNEGNENTGLQLNFQADVYCYSCSFDFLARGVQVDASTSTRIQLNCYGCHFEFNKSQSNWSSSSCYLRIGSGSGAPQAINLFGGLVQQDSGGSGTQLPYVFDAGQTGVSAPHGITLDRVQRSLQSGTALSNPSQTGRFLDNQ
ncbi:MAG: hypothetical protein ACREBW_04200, partial [Candidatus Micrarchaeaceae archaeon]